MVKTKRDLRNKSVINPRLQWTLAMRIVLQFLVFLTAVILFSLMGQYLKNPSGGLGEILAAVWEHNGTIVLALLCLIPAFIRDTLRMSHQVAGPIFNLHRACEQLADGEEDVLPLKFRDGDMWPQLPDTFNRMVTTLRRSDTDQPASETVTDAETTNEPVGELAAT